MEILIDGYNLLHASDRFGEGDREGTLQGSREALLEFLGAHLTERQRRRTTIVFDAAGAPSGLPYQSLFEGISVLFARDYPDADSLIEELIEESSAPKQLTVVSSDHRVQRAARRRGATWIDSAAWLRGLRPQRPRTGTSPKMLDVGDPQEWINTFSDSATLSALAEDASSPVETLGPVETQGDEKESKRTEAPREMESPFPPGYAEDLAQELEDEGTPSGEE